MKSYFLIIMMVLAVFISISFVSAKDAMIHDTSGHLPRNKGMTEAEIVTMYDQLEAELIERFRVQKERGDVKLTNTIKALGHIRSKKAVRLLLDNLEIVSGTQTTQISGFQPVRIVGANTLENLYIALDSLEQIGVTLDNCISEIEKSEDGLLRELLLVQLAYACHGKAFVSRVRNQNESGKKDWKRVVKLVEGRVSEEK